MNQRAHHEIDITDMIEATVTPLVIQEKKSGVTSYYTCAGKGKGGAYVLTASRLCGPLRLTGP